MSIPPQPSPRKLERSRSDRVLGGVCGGLANYLNVDATLVRVLTVVVALSTGVPIILYLLALLLIPEEGTSQPPQSYPPVGGAWTYNPYPYQSAPGSPEPTYAPGPGTPGPADAGAQSGGPRQYGVPPTSADEAIWGPGGAPWQQPQPAPHWQQPPSPSGEPGPAPRPAPSEGAAEAPRD